MSIPGRLRDGLLATRFDRRSVRTASPFTIPLAYGSGILVLVGTLVVMSLVADPIRTFLRASHGFLTQTMLAYIPLFVVVLGGVVALYGELGPSDVGIRADRLPVAVAVVGSTWVVSELLAVTVQIGTGSELVVSEALRTGVVAVVGAYVTQILAVGLFEETLFRGFLLPQFEGYLADRVAWSGRVVFGVALLVSQSLFGLYHAPLDLITGQSIALVAFAVIKTTGIGILFALLYYRTGNLLIGVGLHGLVNVPYSIVAGGGKLTVYVSLLALVFFVLVGPLVHDWAETNSIGPIDAELP